MEKNGDRKTKINKRAFNRGDKDELFEVWDENVEAFKIRIVFIVQED